MCLQGTVTQLWYRIISHMIYRQECSFRLERPTRKEKKIYCLLNKLHMSCGSFNPNHLNIKKNAILNTVIIIWYRDPTKHFDWTKGIPWMLIHSITALGLLTLCFTSPHRCSNHLFIPNPHDSVSKPDGVEQHGVITGPTVWRWVGVV